MRYQILKAALILVLACSGLPAAAITLDLDQAVDRALNADPRIREQAELVKAAQALVQEAEGSDDLSLDVNAFLSLAPDVKGGFYEGGAKTCPSLPCTPRRDLYDFDSVGAWTGLEFKLIKPLATFGKIEHYTKAAKGRVAIQETEVRKQRIETRYDITRAYYGYLTARDSRYLLEDVQRRVDKTRELIQRWLDEDKGNVKQSDLYALETAGALLEKYLAKARAVEQIALDGLKVLTGVGMGNELNVADTALTPLPLPEDELPALTQRALAQRPEMEQLQAGLKARRELTQAKQAEGRPNVYAGVVGSIAYAPGRDSLDHPYVTDEFNHAAAAPVLGIQWTFDSGVQPARVAQAQAELDALIEKDAFARQGIPYDVAEQYHQAHALYEQVQSLEKGSRSGRRWMISAYADFEAGLEKADTVIDAYKTYVLTHSDYLATVNDYNMQRFKLKRAAGDFQ